MNRLAAITLISFSTFVPCVALHAQDATEVAAKSSVATKPSSVIPRVGSRVPDFVIDSPSGEKVGLSDHSGADFIVAVFMGTSCPIANAYIPDLKAIQAQFGEEPSKGDRSQSTVQVIGINANPAESAEAVAEHSQEYDLNFPVLIDTEQLAVDLLGVSRTPEVVILDGRRNIRYRGRIDDRIGYDFRRETPKRADLKVALGELMAGKKVSVPQTETVGCLITRTRSTKPSENITYSGEVASIVYKRCTNCHHPGTAAPFSLLTYEETRDRSSMIREVIVQRRMPPWSADPRYGHFSNDLRMTKKEIDTVVAWIDAGTPVGAREQIPSPPAEHTVEGWMIGKPDKIIKMPKTFTVKATGTVQYQYFVTPTDFTKDMWVQAAEARPGNHAVVHHIIAFVREKGSRQRQLLPSVGGYAPGEEPNVFPDGVGFKIPAGAEIVWQLHYTPTGKVEKDRSELGLIFCDTPPARRSRGGLAINRRFRIPANAGNHKLSATARVWKDIELLTLMPHTHLRGKDFRYTAVYPDGRREILLNVPNYDFNWQHRYRFDRPIRLPAGSQIECVAHYDNSDQNPANPDPTETVRWGDQTWEEMMIGFYTYVEPLPEDKQSSNDRSERARSLSRFARASRQSSVDSRQRSSFSVLPEQTVDADVADDACSVDEADETEVGAEGAQSEETNSVDTPAEKTPVKDASTEETAGAETSAKTAAENSPTVEKGRILKRYYEFKEAEKRMEYGLYVPRGYSKEKKTPLIVALHGLYSNPQQILRYPGFTEHAEKHGTILVAPMGYNDRGWYGSLDEVAGRKSRIASIGQLSEKDVMNVLKIVRTEFQIDNDRIYLMGHSMGGGGTLHLSMKYPDIWAATAPIAPAAYGAKDKLKAAQHIPSIVVQGDRDRLVPVAGTRKWVEQMKALKMTHRYIEVAGGDHLSVGWRYFDDIFEFFDKYTKSNRPKLTAPADE